MPENTPIIKRNRKTINFSEAFQDSSKSKYPRKPCPSIEVRLEGKFLAEGVTRISHQREHPYEKLTK